MSERTGPMERAEFSLGLKHPSLAADEACARLGLVPYRSWRVGDQRKAPNGRILEGFRDDSRAGVHLATSPTDEIETTLADVLKRLTGHAEYLCQFTASGGTATVELALFIDYPCSWVLTHETMRCCAELCLSIDLFIYPPDRPEDFDEDVARESGT